MWTTEDLFPNVIRRMSARAKPYARVVSPDGTLEDITFANLDNASNRAAWFLDRMLDKDEETVYYMGRSDIRYVVWVLAAMKAGKCVRIPSYTRPGIKNAWYSSGNKRQLGLYA
jgi:acyl-coenzyme A synthetase/AMP-(fatty) acid ligase